MFLKVSCVATEIQCDGDSTCLIQHSSILSHHDLGYGRTNPEQACAEVGPEGPPKFTNCPMAKWVDEMVRTDPSPGKTIVSIGCNKGNDAIRFMELWDLSVEKFWSQTSWEKNMAKNIPYMYACAPQTEYVTARMLKQSVLAEDISGTPTGVCVEPMPNNVHVLKATSAKLGYRADTPHGSFHIVQAAVVAKASHGQTLPFPNLKAGWERAHLNDHDPDVDHVQVPAKTADMIINDLALDRIDILSIDTEGYDAEVLQGAKEALQKARYLEFEVHRDWAPWMSTSLKSVIDNLDQHGFTCYWAGNNGKLTDIKACWDDDFETGIWANAACVKRGDTWAKALQKFAA